MRYLPNGTPDPSFGTTNNGIVITNLGGTDNAANACVLQPDGKIIAVGYTNARDPGVVYDFGLVRYLPNGTPDPSFGTTNNGIVITNLGGTNNYTTSCVLQPDGKVIAVGYTNKRGGDYDFALVRYLPNGTPDPSFGTTNNGIVITNLGGTDNAANACVLQPDGKIIAVGYTNARDPGVVYDFGLVRYLPNGTPDPSFGTTNNGIVITNLGGTNNYTTSCVLQPDGKVIAVGYTNKRGGDYDFALVRYLPNGTPDPSFGTNGIVITNLGGTFNLAYACVLQPNGKVIAVGYINTGPDGVIALVRYNTDGTPDTTFGSNNNGIITTYISGTYNQAAACSLQPDGKIIAAGHLFDGATVFALVRYINPFTLASFTASYSSVGLL